MTISQELINFARQVEKELSPQMEQLEVVAEYNQMKVLLAMQEQRLSEAHFAPSTGYGYNDMGRDTLEAIYATVFKAEAALVRQQIVSGTHALAAALFGNLRPGDTLLSVTGAPYDTLHGVIGINPTTGSLAEYGVTYRQVDLTSSGHFDYEAIAAALQEYMPVKMVAIQRSKGYSWRPSYTIAQLRELITFIKKIAPETICMVDNCYGEFVEQEEPIEAGADMAVGSLIKNPGGGLASVGGYVVGKQACIEGAASRVTAPGLGAEVGPSLGLTGTFAQGLFLAPQVVAGSLRGAILAAGLFEKLNFEVLPGPCEPRADIVQAIKLGSSEGLNSFCRCIQGAAPVDSFVVPEASPMPGYGHPVIMAAGAFVQGSSIELSADAPLCEPYIVYLQGGLTRYHAKIGILYALQGLINLGLTELGGQS